MNFHVHTQALRSCHTKLQSLSTDVPTAVTYTDNYLHVERSSAGIFQNAVSVNDNARSAVEGMLDKLKSVLHESAGELTRVAQHYDDTDLGVSQAMDDKYDKVTVAPGDSYANHAGKPEDTTPEKPDDYEPPEGIPDDEPEPTPGGGGGSW